LIVQKNLGHACPSRQKLHKLSYTPHAQGNSICSWSIWHMKTLAIIVVEVLFLSKQGANIVGYLVGILVKHLPGF
jgi:hypothetical protein